MELYLNYLFVEILTLKVGLMEKTETGRHVWTFKITIEFIFRKALTETDLQAYYH
jgi:hypothetical protein